jgi:hypothetical protein
MSYFPSISLLSVPTPIPSILKHLTISSSSGGVDHGFSMGGRIPSTSTIPMSGSMLSGVSLPFGWNILSGFGAIPSQVGIFSTSGRLISHWLAHHFMREQLMGETLHNGEDFPLFIPLILRCSSLGPVLGTHLC